MKKICSNFSVVSKKEYLYARNAQKKTIVTKPLFVVNTTKIPVRYSLVFLLYKFFMPEPDN